jgi:hypothetical protein
MNEFYQVVLSLGFFVGVILLSRRFMAWKIRRAADFILRDLKEKGAMDPFSAVELPYAHQPFIRLGLRDYRPKTLEYLVLQGIVGRTGQGKYFLKSPTFQPGSESQQ